MLLLSTELVWHELMPGVRVRFRPIGRLALRRAREAMRTVIAEQGVEARQDAGDAFSDTLIREGIVEWEGIGDAEGQVLPVTPDTITAFLADPRLFEEADAAYVLPWLARDAEKNVSAPSSNGTLTGGDAGGRYCQLSCSAGQGARCEACPYRRHEPHTEEGEGVAELIRRGWRQLRAGFGGAYALDWTALLLMAEATGVDRQLLGEVLPEIEPVILAACRGDDDGGE